MRFGKERHDLARHGRPDLIDGHQGLPRLALRIDGLQHGGAPVLGRPIVQRQKSCRRFADLPMPKAKI